MEVLVVLGFLVVPMFAFVMVVCDVPKLINKTLDLHHQRKLKEIELKVENLKWLEHYKE